MYSSNFTIDNKTFCLSLHYNDDDSYLFVNGRKVTEFKAKNSELIKYPRRSFKRLLFKYTGSYENIYDFSTDYTAITNDKIFVSI